MWKIDPSEAGVKIAWEDGWSGVKKFFLGKDGTPLTFWSEKGAQLKADKLNRMGERPITDRQWRIWFGPR